MLILKAFSLPNCAGTAVLGLIEALLEIQEFQGGQYRSSGCLLLSSKRKGSCLSLASLMPPYPVVTGSGFLWGMDGGSADMAASSVR